MSEFISSSPTLEDYWRGIILLGRNVASYKFALAKSLLELSPAGGDLLLLNDLSPVFANHICEHLKSADKQGTSSSSKFLEECRKFNLGQLSETDLVTTTEKLGFVNVIDAFHRVGNDDVPSRFFVDERKEHKGIRITDEFSYLTEGDQIGNLPSEVDARWSLVEAAWEMKISSSLVSIDFDPIDERLYRPDSKLRRKSVTSTRDALNGYQKGQCFYCYDLVSLDGEIETTPDVDHFHAHMLKQFDFRGVDGVWNLVLSCKDCNRGPGGKFEKLPGLKYLERLNTRNEYLISSNHPLRETLIQQTGKTSQERRTFLNDYYNDAWKILIHTWDPEPKGTPRF